MADLHPLRVAILASDGFEEAELKEPLAALREAGAQVDVIGPQAGVIQGFRHMEPSDRVTADRSLDEVNPGEYEALMLPGGALNADFLRADERALDFVRQFDEARKPIAAICHAPWLLVSADLVDGRTLTSYHTIQDDIRNAGGNWVDEAVVRDGNWVTSRQPADLPQFNAAMLALFEHALAHH
ncbi:MAG TPA: type 1 glutamine amidotransferase domain-containing protein [Pirellulales bacterium]|nr:type 1 glutamine amidotransferase domain-containing protein [Pirellulales bacterium]